MAGRGCDDAPRGRENNRRRQAVEMDPSLGRANEEIGSGGADVGADGCNARAAGWAGEQRCGGGRARLMAPCFLRRSCRRSQRGLPPPSWRPWRRRPGRGGAFRKSTSYVKEHE